MATLAGFFHYEPVAPADSFSREKLDTIQTRSMDRVWGRFERTQNAGGGSAGQRRRKPGMTPSARGYAD